jgi:hypothetical protein
VFHDEARLWESSQTLRMLWELGSSWRHSSWQDTVRTNYRVTIENWGHVQNTNQSFFFFFEYEYETEIPQGLPEPEWVPKYDVSLQKYKQTARVVIKSCSNEAVCTSQLWRLAYARYKRLQLPSYVTAPRSIFIHLNHNIWWSVTYKHPETSSGCIY